MVLVGGILLWAEYCGSANCPALLGIYQGSLPGVLWKPRFKGFAISNLQSAVVPAAQPLCPEILFVALGESVSKTPVCPQFTGTIPHLKTGGCPLEPTFTSNSNAFLLSLCPQNLL